MPHGSISSYIVYKEYIPVLVGGETEVVLVLKWCFSLILAAAWPTSSNA